MRFECFGLINPVLDSSCGQLNRPAQQGAGSLPGNAARDRACPSQTEIAGGSGTCGGAAKAAPAPAMRTKTGASSVIFIDSLSSTLELADLTTCQSTG